MDVICTTVAPRPRSRLAVLALAAACALALGGGCGDDSASGGSAKPARKAASNKKANKKKGKKGEELRFYDKIEKYAADEEEATALRHEFVATDFVPDVTGERRRDPFRSYVIQQIGIGQKDETAQAADSSQLCDSKNLVATNYSLRDLRLVGIVLRGTRSYALFRDSAAYGHIVRRGDCLGQEKARVATIGAGFVSLEVASDTASGEIVGPVQERSIQLYPEELQLENPQ